MVKIFWIKFLTKPVMYCVRVNADATPKENNLVMRKRVNAYAKLLFQEMIALNVKKGMSMIRILKSVFLCKNVCFKVGKLIVISMGNVIMIPKMDKLDVNVLVDSFTME